MNYSIFLRKLKSLFIRVITVIFFRPRPKISILIPFSSENQYRNYAFNWLLRYWKFELPDAEIIVGHSDSRPFCKNEAFNDAFKRSRGQILVLMDADGYIPGSVIEYCADKILENMDNHLWFIPYRHLYRLNEKVTFEILNSSPSYPLRIPCPPPDDIISDNKDRSKYGHRYGAMCMIVPREALETLGCFDERFRGWGGEDIALLRALDTLYGKHKTKKGCIFHLWHPFIGDSYKTRMWEGQDSGNVNNRLASEYHKATRNPSMMRKLVDEACDDCKSS